jgi:flagellar hook assembly protein FlgD
MLFQNYPNPFNPETTIAFQLPQTAQVELTIFNTLGEKVAQLFNQPLSAGHHEIRWNGCDPDGHKVPSGLYFYRLETGTADAFVDIGKMLLTK